MDKILNQLKSAVYNKYSLKVSNYRLESESQDYNACRYDINGLHIIGRTAKITPTKGGQFVTFWKRVGNGPIEPFSKTDTFDFLVVNVFKDGALGQFVFPKSQLIQKCIVTAGTKEGKRAFRVYPVWDKVQSKQAQRTQKWQLNYFYEINDSKNLNRVKDLYSVR